MKGDLDRPERELNGIVNNHNKKIKFIIKEISWFSRDDFF